MMTDWIRDGKYVEVVADGPDGPETFKMRMCENCDQAVDVCQCDLEAEV